MIELGFIQNFLSNNYLIGLLLIFFLMIISNIFPVMFFIYPHLIIFLGIFLGNEFGNFVIPFLVLILGSLIGEIISYYLGYKYGQKILNKKFFTKNKPKKIIDSLKKKEIKTIIIGKFTPGIFGIIPTLSGIIKINPIKFILIDLLIITIIVSYLFIILLFGTKFIEKYLIGDYIWYILLFLIFIYILYIIWKNKEKFSKI